MFNCYGANMCCEANMGCDNNDSKSNLVILVYLYLLFFSTIGVLYHFYSQTERKYNKLYYKILNDVSLFLDNNILDEQKSSGSSSGSVSGSEEEISGSESVEEKSVNEGFAASAFKSMSDSFAKKSHEYFFDNY